MNFNTIQNCVNIVLIIFSVDIMFMFIDLLTTAPETTGPSPVLCAVLVCPSPLPSGDVEAVGPAH